MILFVELCFRMGFLFFPNFSPSASCKILSTYIYDIWKLADPPSSPLCVIVVGLNIKEPRLLFCIEVSISSFYFWAWIEALLFLSCAECFFLSWSSSSWSKSDCLFWKDRKSLSERMLGWFSKNMSFLLLEPRLLVFFTLIWLSSFRESLIAGI